MERENMKLKKNNKGFTMVEILAVVVIIGILSGVAIPAVSRYISKSKKQSYATMESSIYDGARNYIMDENRYLNKCTSGYSNIESVENMLVDFQYIEALIDPSDKSKHCTYAVHGCMSNQGSDEILPTYEYKIELNCLNYSSCNIYKDDGSITPCE